MSRVASFACAVVLLALPIGSSAQEAPAVAGAHQRFAEDFSGGRWNGVSSALAPDAQLTVIEAAPGQQGSVSSVVKGAPSVIAKLQQIRSEHTPLRLTGCQPLETDGALCTYEVPQRMKFFTGTKLRGDRFCCVMVGMKGL